ncbi:DUF493 family protein [Algoriphagus namhaensis]|uniref:DUF493 family protein n=1 Tax=Algoriphagus namhaensis TaxID=915353 RepID=A0ABV8ATD7_9BACT
MKEKFDKVNFREKLLASGEFPMLYMFKFIVPKGKKDEVSDVFPKNKVELKESSGGKYISATIRIMAESPDQIINYYEEAAKIEGVISL